MDPRESTGLTWLRMGPMNSRMSSVKVTAVMVVTMQSSGPILILKHNDGTPSVTASTLLMSWLSGRFSTIFTMARTTTLWPMQRRILWLKKLSIPSAVTLCMCLDMPAPVSANSIISVRLLVSVMTSVIIVFTRLNPKSLVTRV